MVTTEEGVHILPDGTKLYKKTWKPDQPPRAIAGYVHGFSDHCNAYYDFFPELASRGIEIRAFDQRGWGRSASNPKQNGLTGPTSLVLADMHSFFLSLVPLTRSEASSPTNPLPLFMIGHSMGGGQVLNYVFNPASPYHTQQQRANKPKKEDETVTLAGVLVFSPLIAMHPSAQPGELRLKLGRFAGKLLPHLHLSSTLDAKMMSRDPKVVEDYVNDPLCHDSGTLEGLSGMFDRVSFLEKWDPSSSSKLQSPVPPIWIGHGTQDIITSFDASKRFFNKDLPVPNKTFKEYEFAYHKLFAEPEGVKERLVEDMATWMLERSPASTESTTATETVSVPPPTSAADTVTAKEQDHHASTVTEESDGKSKL